MADLPTGLRHLVEQALQGQADLTIVAVASGELALMLEAAQADVVVVPLPRGDLPAVAGRLLDEYPHVGVLCIDMSSGVGIVCRLHPGLTPVDAASPTAVAAAIRRAAVDLSV